MERFVAPAGTDHNDVIWEYYRYILEKGGDSHGEGERYCVRTQDHNHSQVGWLAQSRLLHNKAV